MVHRCQICGEEHGTHDAAWKHVRYVHPEIPRRDINTKIEEVVRSPDGTEIINKPGQGGEHGQESRQSRARQPLFQIASPGLFIAMVLLVVLLMASGGGTETVLRGRLAAARGAGARAVARKRGEAGWGRCPAGAPASQSPGGGSAAGGTGRRA